MNKVLNNSTKLLSREGVKEMRKCPICKTPLHVRDYSDSTVSECYENCIDGCGKYHYEEWCGNYRTNLGGTILLESHNSSKTQFKKSLFIYKRKLARLRKVYRNGKFN